MRAPLLPLLLAAALLAPAPPALPEGPPGEAPEPRTVTVESAEGIRLEGTLTEPAGGGEGKAAVLALHFEGGDRTCWKAVAGMLAERGISLLALDLRGHGGSRMQGEVDLGPRAEARDPELWKEAIQDAGAGLKYLRATLLADGKKLGLLGAGAGMAVALCAAEKDERVRVLYGVAPDPSGCGVPGAASAVRWDGRPLGFVVGSADGKGPSAPLAKAMWKKGEIRTLPDAGAFVTEEKTTFWQAWLSPGLLGVEPFSEIALASAPILEGKPRWEKGEERAGPSSWQRWELR